MVPTWGFFLTWKVGCFCLCMVMMIHSAPSFFCSFSLLRWRREILFSPCQKETCGVGVRECACGYSLGCHYGEGVGLSLAFQTACIIGLPLAIFLFFNSLKGFPIFPPTMDFQINTKIEHGEAGRCSNNSKPHTFGIPFQIAAKLTILHWFRSQWPNCPTSVPNKVRR